MFSLTSSSTNAMSSLALDSEPSLVLETSSTEVRHKSPYCTDIERLVWSVQYTHTQKSITDLFSIAEHAEVGQPSSFFLLLCCGISANCQSMTNTNATYHKILWNLLELKVFFWFILVKIANYTTGDVTLSLYAFHTLWYNSIILV